MGDYNLVTNDGMADEMDAFANRHGDPAAAEECRRLVAMADRVNARINACNDFANAQVKTEMLQRMTKRLEDLQYNWTNDYLRLEQDYAQRKMPANDPGPAARQADRRRLRQEV